MARPRPMLLAVCLLECAAASPPRDKPFELAPNPLIPHPLSHPSLLLFFHFFMPASALHCARRLQFSFIEVTANRLCATCRSPLKELAHLRRPEISEHRGYATNNCTLNTPAPSIPSHSLLPLKKVPLSLLLQNTGTGTNTHQPYFIINWARTPFSRSPTILH